MKSIFTNQDEELVKHKSFPNKEIIPAIGDNIKIKENKVRRTMEVLRWISSLSKGKVSLLNVKQNLIVAAGKSQWENAFPISAFLSHC